VSAPTPSHLSHSPPPPLPSPLPPSPFPPPLIPRAELGLIFDENDAFGVRLEDDLDEDEQRLIANMSNTATRVRKVPVAISQILFAAASAFMAVGMATTPADWVLTRDFGPGTQLHSVLGSVPSRRTAAFLIRLMGVTKMAACFYPALVVAEDGRFRSTFTTRFYTILAIIPCCMLAGWFGYGSMTGVGWASAFFYITDELLGLLFSLLELIWSIRRWAIKNKALTDRELQEEHDRRAASASGGGADADDVEVRVPAAARGGDDNPRHASDTPRNII
jgi:hypothetical protein